MRISLSTKLLVLGILATVALLFPNCGSVSTSAPEWEQRNEELIKKYDLKVRSLTGLPDNTIASNLEPAKVKSLDELDSISLYPGVKAHLFWGTGTMIGILNIEPNAKIPEENLTSDKFLFVLEGSIDLVSNGTSINLIGKKR